MKIISIVLLMFVLSVGFSFSLDLLSGFGFKRALSQAFNPFEVRENFEATVFIFYIVLVLTLPVISFFKKRKQKKA